MYRWIMGALAVLAVAVSTGYQASAARHLPGCHSRACDERVREKLADHLKGCNTFACDRRIAKRWAAKHPLSPALASWYDYPGGQIACAGMSGTSYGIAHRTLPCGTRVRLCKSGCVTAVVYDRGPFIAGRTFDLTPDVKNAIGCGDLCSLRYRVLKR